MRVDEALETLGGYGRYQLLTFLMIGLNFMYTPMHIFSDVFTAYEPDHHCRIEMEDNQTHEDVFVFKDHEHSGKQVPDSCTVYSSEFRNTTAPCPDGIQYEMSGGPTIVTEWQLSCNKSQTVMTITVHGTAAVLGAVVFSPFADAYGRKALFLMCWWQTALLSLGMFFINDISSFWVLRFLSRLYTEGAELAMFVLACEFFPINQRPFAAFALYLFYAVGQMLLAFQAYLIRHWRYLQLAISVGLFVLLPFSMFLPESLHWLVSWGKIKEAERIVRRAARINGVSLPPDFSLESTVASQDDETSVESAGGVPGARPRQSGDTRLHQVHPHLSHFFKLAEYMKNGTLRKDFLISSFLWAVSAFLYYGLTVMPIHLEIEDGFYLNYFLSGAVMVPAFTSIFILNRFGRKKPLSVFFGIAGIFMIAYSLTPINFGSTHLGYVQLVLKLIAKCSTTAGLVSTRLLVAEIFPTTVRSTCVGLAAFIGLLGGSAGLYLPIMKKKSIWSGVAAGVTSLIASVLCTCLPETSNRPLPENIKDLMLQYRNVFQNMLFSQLNGIAQEGSRRKSSAALRKPSNAHRPSIDNRKISWANADGGTPQIRVENTVPTISETVENELCAKEDCTPSFATSVLEIGYDNPSFASEVDSTTKL